MRARMKNPAFVLPDGMKGIGAIFGAVNGGGISEELQEIVGLSASQINGCSAGLQAHSQIGVINMFNRLNAAIREPVGTTWAGV